MKHTWKKLLALVSAISLLTASICVQAEESAGTQTADAVSSTAVSAEELEELYDGLNPEAVVLTVGEDEVPLKKAYFLMKFQQAIVQDMQTSVYGSNWYNLSIYEGDRSFQENMKESIMKLMVRMSLARQHQEELGISLSKEEQDNIATAVDMFMKGNSDAALKAMMADRETVTEVLEDYTLLSKAIKVLVEDTKVEYGEAVTYSYVYGSFGTDAGTDLANASEETVGLIEDINAIHDAALSGVDFNTAAAEKGYPVAMHTFIIGDEGDALVEANEVMVDKAVGELSDVIYVGNNDGAFVGYREEVDSESLEDAKASYKRTQQLKTLKSSMNQWIEETKVVVDEDIWSQVTMKKPVSAYRMEITATE